MLTRADYRKGWCPGALSPMQAKDGLLVRLRLSGGALSADALRRIAAASRFYGNGLVDLSARGNLQLRGVAEASLPLLVETFDELGLVDHDAGAEAVRNVMVSPLAGLGAGIDIRPIGVALEHALVAARDLHRLPGKFGFLIDDGGPLSLDDETADVRFVWCEAETAFAISIGGRADEAVALGFCAPADVVDTALRLARAFLALGAGLVDPPRRMTDLISSRRAGEIAAAAGMTLGAPQGRQGAAAPPPIGFFNAGAVSCFGAGATFGRLSSAMLDAAAEAAQAFAAGEIRLTPWRALILPHADISATEATRRHFATAGFIIDPDDPRLAVAACGGRAACARATTTTHEHALRLAALARRIAGPGVALHISGCAKGCARPRATPITLVGADGLYDLVLAGAPFDQSIQQNLTLTAAREILESMAHERGEQMKSKCA